MDKKKLEKLLNNSKNVKVADDSIVSQNKAKLNTLFGFFNLQDSPYSFHSDDSNLILAFGLITDNSLIFRKHKEFFLNRVNEFLVNPLTEKDLKAPLKLVLPKIEIKPHDPKNHPLKSFLGIKYIEDELKDRWSLAYFFSQKAHVEYFDGFISHKSKPLNGDKEMVNKILEDHNQMKKNVYIGQTGKYFKCVTSEGEELVFKTILEVCNWVIARASNYVEGKKESW